VSRHLVSKHLLFRLAQAAAVALVAYFIVAYLAHSWGKVSAYSWHLRPLPLAGSLGLFLVFYWLNAWAWWLLLRGFGLPAGRSRAAATWAQSILARYVPGTVFMFVGRGVLSARQGLPLPEVSAAMVYEQVLGFCGALITAAGLFPFWRGEPAAATWSLVSLPVLLALLHPRLFRPAAARLLRLFKRAPLERVLAYRYVLELLALYVGMWLVAGVACYLAAAAVTDAGHGLVPLMIAAYALAYVAGMIAFFVPSGVGVREAVLAGALVGSLPGGVALAWALLLRIWQTLIELLFVAWATVMAAPGQPVASAGAKASPVPTASGEGSQAQGAPGQVERHVDER